MSYLEQLRVAMGVVQVPKNLICPGCGVIALGCHNAAQAGLASTDAVP